MTVRSRTLAAGLGLAFLAAGLLTACATPVASGPTPSATSSGGSGAGQELDIEAAWLDGGRLIGLVTQGSSSVDCVPMAGDTSYANGVLEVELLEPAADTVCTADYVPRVTLVGVPEGVDPTQELEIRLTGAYRGDTDLDGVPGLASGDQTDYLPSAGWTDEDGQFVILTWGSSTCAPVIENVVASGPAEVTVTFVTPPADQVCTMDMAPRAAIAFVDSLDDDSDVFAVLTGAEFDNVRIPIVGTD